MSRIIFFPFVLILARLTAVAADGMIHHSGTEFQIREHLYIYEDITAERPLSEIRLMDFTPLQKGIPNLGVSRAAHWIRFELKNSGHDPRLILSIDHADIDELDIYKVDQGVAELIGSTGQSRPVNDRLQPYEGFKFDLDLDQEGMTTIYIRAFGFKHIHLPITIAGVESIAPASATRNLLIGGYLAMMFTMLLYNLFIFISIRDISYIWYILYILIISIAQLAVVGVAQDHLFGHNTWLASRSSMLLVLLAIIIGMQFARKFIGTREILPQLNKGFPLLFSVIGIIFFISLLGDPWIGYVCAQIISGISASYLLVVVISAVRKGSRQATFFLLAWTPFLVGVLLFVLKDAGIFPYTTLTNLGMTVGSAIEVILLSFGLADRINVLRREKECSQSEALAILKENERIIREQNVILEEKVDQRTFALQESNEHLKKTQARLVNAEKMASLGQLTAGIAHQINNPINFITSNIIPLRRNLREIIEAINAYMSIDPEHAAEQLHDLRAECERLGLRESIEELDEMIDSISEGCNRTAEIVRGLRNFSGVDGADLMESNLNEGLRRTLGLLAPQYRDRVKVETEFGAIPLVDCFPGKINQVFMNILINAIQATLARETAKEKWVKITSAYADGKVMISIVDNGIGMTDDVRSRIFDPFFTTRPVGEGTGLGMAIVHGIVKEHKGEILVNSKPGVGTEFCVILPTRQEQLIERRA